jgi:DNA-binding HxlR family transcriptional regulator
VEGHKVPGIPEREGRDQVRQHCQPERLRHRPLNEFLGAGEGIASNILADRLARLEAYGIVTKDADPADGRRYTYRLTGKGIDLAPLLVELVLWSARYERTDAPAATVHAMRTRRQQFLQQVRRGWMKAGG